MHFRQNNQFQIILTRWFRVHATTFSFRFIKSIWIWHIIREHINDYFFEFNFNSIIHIILKLYKFIEIHFRKFIRNHYRSFIWIHFRIFKSIHFWSFNSTQIFSFMIRYSFFDCSRRNRNWHRCSCHQIL